MDSDLCILQLKGWAPGKELTLSFLEFNWMAVCSLGNAIGISIHEGNLL